MKFIFLVLLWSPVLSTNNDFEQIPKAKVETLKLVHAIWRHGDRTPSTLIPGDHKNTMDTWSLGLGELTKLGAQQEFRLGQFIRKRYEGFLNMEYSPFEVYVRSSDYNRTLASGQAVMTGLYSIDGKMQLNPVPIHSVPKSIDNLLYDRIPCPVAEEERKKVYSSYPEVRQVQEQNAQLLHYLGEKSEVGNVPLTVRQMWFIYDPLNAAMCHNDSHSLPDWVNGTIKDEIWKLYDVSSSFLYHTDLLKRLRGGPLFADITNRMKLKQENTLDQRFKFYGYSGHDTTIAALLGTFGISLVKFPVYSSAVFIELHQENNEYVVRLFYKSDTNNFTLTPLEIPNCLSNCRLDDLLTLRSHLIPADWELECGIRRWYYFQSETYLIAVLALTVIIIFLTVSIIKLLQGSNKRRRTDDMELKVQLNSSESGVHLLSDSDSDDDI